MRIWVSSRFGNPPLGDTTTDAKSDRFNRNCRPIPTNVGDKGSYAVRFDLLASFQARRASSPTTSDGSTQ